MLNHKDVVSQAKDKQSENLAWIERESELSQVFEKLESRRKEPRESFAKRAIEMLKSIALLLVPGVGHRANR